MGVFKQLWGVYKENGCELTLHRTVATQLGANEVAVDAFVGEMEAYLRDPDMFLLMLSVGLGGMVDTQSSFVGLLLREDALQSRVVDLLLEKLSEFSSEMDGAGVQAMENNIPKLILREIRWIDHVVNSGDLVEKLISSLPAFPLTLQQEIIYILPEIAGDEDAHLVIDAMLDLIRNQADLVVCCIEALGNFNVVNEQTDDVVKCVLERLDSSPLVDLPVIVKYLVQEAPGADVDLIANQLREKLSSTLSFQDGSSHDGPSCSSTGRAGTAQSDVSGNEEALVLNAIIQGFYFRDDLMKAFLLCIAKCGEAESTNGLRLLDMWILLAGHTIPRDRTKIERLIKRNVSSHAISRSLLVRSIQGHANALRSYFPSLLQIAGQLLSQANRTCASMGGLLFELLFEEFSLCRDDAKNQAAFYQGEIVTSLLRFCLSAAGEATIAALRTFLVLLSPRVSFEDEVRDRKYEQSHFKRRFRFEIFLPAMKQMLDAIDIYPLEQVRYVYDILFAVGGPDDAELCNTLRKQSFHQEVRYRFCGIIGSVSRMNQYLLQFREDTERQRVDGSQLEKDAATTLNKCVVDLFDSATSQGKCVAFMLEELRRWVEGVSLEKYSSDLVTIISDRAMDVLTNQFMEEYDVSRERAGEYKKSTKDGAMKTDLWFSLDDRLCPMYLKVFDVAASSNVREQESLHYLTSLVELVLECVRKKDDVRSVDCVLICPIQLMEKSVIEDIAGLDDSVQNLVCSVLWHAINWTRSILGFYANETHEYHKKHVAQRLHNLIELESILINDLLHTCPSFGPPGMQNSDFSVSKLSGKPKKKPGRPPKVSPSTDRAALVRSSFNPIRADALKILGSLQSTVVANAQAGCSQQELHPHAQIEFLMNLFEEVVNTAKARMKTKHESLIMVTFSSESFWTHNCTKARNQAEHLCKPGECEISILLQSACHYAYYYADILRRSANGDDEVIDAFSERVARSICRRYLSVSAAFFEDVTCASLVQKVRFTQHCQDYFLPQEQHATLDRGVDEILVGEILESCFVSASKLSSATENDIQLATDLIRSLLGIASIGYGYPAADAPLRAQHIHLIPRSEQRASDEMCKQVSTMAMSFLQQDWSGGDKKYIYKSSHLDILLAGFLNHGKILLDNVQSLALDGIFALIENGGSEHPSIPTLNKRTVAVFHRGMFQTLIAATARLDFESYRSATGDDSVLLLNYLTQAVLLFKLLVAITKSYQKSKVVATVLKLGRKFVEVVLRAMPFLQRCFIDHNESVMKVISEVQVATRRMQVLCAHGKLVKDASAASQVPMVKKLLERFIYQGEELARSHGVLDAFTTGVLKNRRIDGTTISKEELAAMEGDENECESAAETEAGDSSTEDEDAQDNETEGDGNASVSRASKKRK